MYIRETPNKEKENLKKFKKSRDARVVVGIHPKRITKNTDQSKPQEDR
jgi:hypothetical protein